MEGGKDGLCAFLTWLLPYPLSSREPCLGSAGAVKRFVSSKPLGMGGTGWRGKGYIPDCMLSWPLERVETGDSEVGEKYESMTSWPVGDCADICCSIEELVRTCRAGACEPMGNCRGAMRAPIWLSMVFVRERLPKLEFEPAPVLPEGYIEFTSVLVSVSSSSSSGSAYGFSPRAWFRIQLNSWSEACVVDLESVLARGFEPSCHIRR
jgi:hypothetical protein